MLAIDTLMVNGFNNNPFLGVKTELFTLVTGPAMGIGAKMD
jgi:hypothetical protein